MLKAHGSSCGPLRTGPSVTFPSVQIRMSYDLPRLPLLLSLSLPCLPSSSWCQLPPSSMPLGPWRRLLTLKLSPITLYHCRKCRTSFHMSHTPEPPIGSSFGRSQRCAELITTTSSSISSFTSSRLNVFLSPPLFLIIQSPPCLM